MIKDGATCPPGPCCCCCDVILRPEWVATRTTTTHQMALFQVQSLKTFGSKINNTIWHHMLLHFEVVCKGIMKSLSSEMPRKVTFTLTHTNLCIWKFETVKTIKREHYFAEIICLNLFSASVDHFSLSSRSQKVWRMKRYFSHSEHSKYAVKEYHKIFSNMLRHSVPSKRWFTDDASWFVLSLLKT